MLCIVVISSDITFSMVSSPTIDMHRMQYYVRIFLLPGNGNYIQEILILLE